MDDEVKGKGNSVNYKYRMHDPRVGRFFAVDPLADKYPFYSPYAFSGNRVLDAVELEGLEPSSIHIYFIDENGDKTGEFHVNAKDGGHLGSNYLQNEHRYLGIKSSDFELNSNVTIIYNVDSKEVEHTFESMVRQEVEKKETKIETSTNESYEKTIYTEFLADQTLEGKEGLKKIGKLGVGILRQLPMAIMEFIQKVEMPLIFVSPQDFERMPWEEEQ